MHIKTDDTPTVDELGGDCRYILNGGESCGAVRRCASAYCQKHHALCHIPRGSRSEAIAIRQMERASSVIGIGLNSRVLIASDTHGFSWIQ